MNRCSAASSPATGQPHH